MYSRDSSIMRKLLGRGSSNVALESAAVPSGTGDGTWEFSPCSFPSNSHTKHYRGARYVAAAPILSIDASPNGKHLALSGRHILKTVNVEGTQFHEDIDLRAIITSQTGGKGTGISDQLSIQDVKWQSDSSIFTACAGGKIFYYDLNHSRGGAINPYPIQDNTRQITTLDVSPHRRSWLLSGGQDGVVRIWDMRAPPKGPAMEIVLKRRVQAHSESIRCVRWAPRDGFEFACSTENGMIFKGDFRHANFRMRINAHEGSCSSISWHPDGVHLLSGGMDQKLHVWDMTNADRRRRPKWVIHTPAPIGQALWRPSLWSATDNGRRAAQIAVTYDASSQRRHGRNMVHIWDLARPTLPFKVIEQFDMAPTGLLWRDQDILWAVGQDGNLNQCDVAFAPRVIDRQAMSTFAFNPNGEVMMFLDQRQSAPRNRSLHQSSLSAVDITSAASRAQRTSGGTETPSGYIGTSPQNVSLSVSRTDSDEDLTGIFLNPRRPSNSNRTRRTGTRAFPTGTTPKNPPFVAPHQDEDAMPLDQSMHATGDFIMTQGMAFSHTPFRVDPEMYRYLTFHYLTILQRDLPRKDENAWPLPRRIASILEQYGQVAEDARLFRLAQTWRILSHVTQILLHRRGEYHLQVRTGQIGREVSRTPAVAPVRLQAQAFLQSSTAVTTAFVRSGHAPEPAHSNRKQSSLIYQNSTPRDHSLNSARSLLSEEFENTSNMTTPRAHAVLDPVANDRTIGATPLSPVAEAPASFTLPPPAAYPPTSNSPRARLNSQPLSTTSQHSSDTHASTEGYDFYDAEAFTKAIDVPGASKPEKDSHRNTAQFGPQTPSSARDIDCNNLGRTASSDSYGQDHAQILSLSSPNNHGDKELDHHNEYSGRIRGHRDIESPERVRGKGIWDIHGPMLNSESLEDVFAISQATKGTRTSASMSQELSGSMPSDAGTIEMTLSTRQPVASTSPQVSFQNRQPEPTPLEKAEHSDSPTIGEYDYFKWNRDPPFPFPKPSGVSDSMSTCAPIDPYAIIQQTLEFESRKSAVNAAAIVLLLQPLVPERVISRFQAEAILKQHHSRLMNMKCFIEASQLRNLCTKNWAEGMPCWGESFPSIFGAAQRDVQVNFTCPFCNKPREIDPQAGPTAIWTCERCHRTMDPCAVCQHRHVVADLLIEIKKSTAQDQDVQEPVLTSWWYCRGCGHGGHSNCLQAWHYPVSEQGEVGEFSGGYCPQDECGHECLPDAAPPTVTSNPLSINASTSATPLGSFQRAEEPPRATAVAMATDGTASARPLVYDKAHSGNRSTLYVGPDNKVKGNTYETPQSQVSDSRDISSHYHNGAPAAPPTAPSQNAGGDVTRRKSVKFASGQGKTGSKDQQR
ncbi:SEA (Seh1-associated) complex subunit [Ceratocystis pirilliformis]|uniref:SEA (Seh1-associated) complex subunit n=1 Tax=Ceratocystis pirilliformis TaxID=259994 RepID=A0ABR3ZGC1_9PEZI